jgi:hypothetical protein
MYEAISALSVQTIIVLPLFPHEERPSVRTESRMKKNLRMFPLFFQNLLVGWNCWNLSKKNPQIKLRMLLP